MKRVAAALLLATVLTASGCGTVASGAMAGWGDEQELVELNRHLFERMMLHHDATPYEEVALPEYLFVANIGIVESKEEVTTTLENLSIEWVTIENEEIRVRDDTAILIGSMRVQGSVLGFPLPGHMRYMSVFVRTGGGWRLMAQSLTEVNDPRLSVE
jgi:hypothetical protein